MKVFGIFLIFLIAISVNEVHAVMSYSEFQDFCKETKNTNLDLMPIDQRLLANLCDRLDSGLSEKYWNWIGADLDWKNFAQNISNEYAQQIPLFVEKGLEDSLVVDTSISGRDSFPPPMFAYISFYYDEDSKTKRFGEKYIVNIFGEFSKAKDHRLPPLKLFNTGYYLDEIQCKQNLVLIQKYDGSPACVTESTKQKLVERGWTGIVLPSLGSTMDTEPSSPKKLAIDRMQSMILSDASHQEKLDFIEDKVHKTGMKPFSYVMITNLDKYYEHGEKIKFDLINFGYRNWCLMPSISIYYESYQEPIYEGKISHSCPPPWDENFPSIRTWDQDNFRDLPFCRYSGTHIIMAESFEFENQIVGQYFCNGNDRYVPPLTHTITIPEDFTNPKIKPNFIPDKISVKEGDTILFVNQGDAEFWLIGNHDSDSERNLSLHFDPDETREFKRIKSGNYTITIEIDKNPISWMDGRILTE